MRSILIIALLTALLVITACSKSRSTNPGGTATGTAIKTVTVGSLTATLSNSTGKLKQGDQEVTLAFTDSAGKPVDVGAVSLNFHMPAMGGMTAMNESVALTTTDTPGVYRGKVKISMAGEWQVQLAYEGPAGKGKTTFSVPAP